jgi:hypothetical protein
MGLIYSQPNENFKPCDARVRSLVYAHCLKVTLFKQISLSLNPSNLDKSLCLNLNLRRHSKSPHQIYLIIGQKKRKVWFFYDRIVNIKIVLNQFTYKSNIT